MLMGADDGAVDHGVLIVRLIGQMLEHSLPHPAPGPATEAGVDLLPGAEPLRQIAPGNAGAVAVEHSLDEQAVVPGGHAHMPGAAGQQVLDPLPLVVAQGIAAHRAVSSGLQSPT